MRQTSALKKTRMSSALKSKKKKKKIIKEIIDFTYSTDPQIFILTTWLSEPYAKARKSSQFGWKAKGFYKKVC